MKITFYFDVISPYSALAWKVLSRYKDLWNLDLVLKPIFLGGIMAANKNRPPGTLPARGRFIEQDLNRSAKHFGVEIQPVPANFLSEVAKTSIACQRLLCAAQNSESGLSASQVTALVDSLFEGMHSDAQHRDAANNLKIDADFLLCRAKMAGFDSATSANFIAAMNSEAVKENLKTNTNEAIAAGAFGAPAMMVELTSGQNQPPTLFFGSDRFEQLAFLAQKTWLGPNPTPPTPQPRL